MAVDVRYHAARNGRDGHQAKPLHCPSATMIALVDSVTAEPCSADMYSMPVPVYKHADQPSVLRDISHVYL
jgi:hypothetical protein